MPSSLSVVNEEPDVRSVGLSTGFDRLLMDDIFQYEDKTLDECNCLLNRYIGEESCNANCC